jgi:hypothetical protein
MKKMMIVTMIAVLAAAGPACADYTYTFGPGTYFGATSLHNYDSVLVNGGGGDSLTLLDYASALIGSTTPLSHPYVSGGYGIPDLNVADNSTLTIAGGEIGNVYAVGHAHITMTGGSVDRMRACLLPPIPPAIPADKYIQVICKSYSYNSSTKKLTGVWADDSAFNIQLWDSSPWPSGFTYDSINFTIVPEPLTVGLLAFGSLLARRLRRA